MVKFFIIVGEFSEQVGEFFEKVGEFKKIYLKVGELSGDELWQTQLKSMKKYIEVKLNNNKTTKKITIQTVNYDENNSHKWSLFLIFVVFPLLIHFHFFFNSQTNW